MLQWKYTIQNGGICHMTSQAITVTNDAQKLSLHIHGLYLLNGFEVMEGFTENMEECYYLFFYKNHFLTAHQTIKIKRTSTLQKVLAHGLFIPSESPLIPSLLAANSIKCLSLPSTWKMIQKHYNNIEAAHVLTIFDTYLKKRAVLSTLEKTWSELRRDGKLLHAYRILKIARSCYPNNKWAKDLSSHLDYAKYEQYYVSDVKSLLNHDPIHAEKQLFSTFHDKTSFSILDEKLRRESRHIERIALYSTNLNDENFMQTYQTLRTILPKHFSNQDSVSILYTIFVRSLTTLKNEQLKNNLLGLLAKTGQYQETFELLTALHIPLTNAQIDLLLAILKEIDAIEFAGFDAKLLINARTEQLQQLLTELIPRLLSHHDIQFVYQWLTPFHATSLPIMETIRHMHKINDDPDKQHQMGEMYYQMNQLEQAVDCFLWDYELHPTNPRPIKWLTKLYRELGMKEESESYMYLYKQIQKSS